MAYKRISPLPVTEGGTGLTSITAHDLVVGNGTSALNLIAPSATSGVPLVSNGASADPSFTTAVVAGGGTGDTSFTAFSVITGGTTSTGVLQNVSGVGTSGQVLASAGAAALPAWSGGGWILIQSQTASNSASLVFSTGITTTYNVFVVTFKNILAASDANQLVMDWSTDGGSTYINSNYQSGVTVNVWNSSPMFNAFSNSTNLITTSGVASNVIGISGIVYLFELPSASAPFYHGKVYHQSTTFGPVNTQNYGLNTASTAINAIKFSFTAGNITSGVISLYGIKK